MKRLRDLRRAIRGTVLWLGAVPCLAANLPMLGETRLFAKIAHDCAVVDLKTWRHPTRSLLLDRKVAIDEVRLCNAGICPVFFVRFPCQAVEKLLRWAICGVARCSLPRLST